MGTEKNSMDDKETLIDTNVLVHAYVLSNEKKHAVAKNIVQNIWRNGCGITTLQNISEFFFVVTKKVEKPMLANKAKVIVTHLINTHHWWVIDRDETTLLKAIQIVEQYNTPFWDAMIAACMLQHEIKTIFTENVDDFKNVKDIRAINPFKVVKETP